MSAVRRIASEISDLIASGEFQPGERLREVALSERLGTSRTTIREATMVLEFQGLIRREPNRGAIVKSPSHENLKNLHACRRGLEAGPSRFRCLRSASPRSAGPCASSRR